MRGVILAGGTGSRLSPLTRVTNKHLLPVGPKPMIYWPITTLTKAGIREILVVSGREHMGSVLELLGSGSGFDAEFSFRVQDEAGGIAQALLLAEHFAAGDPVTVILGDNIFEFDLDLYTVPPSRCAKVFLKQVACPERFGCPRFDTEGSSILEIIEKPTAPPSVFAVTGLYVYPPDVFRVCRELVPSARGELEITDVNNWYLRQGRLIWTQVVGYWSDAGSPDTYASANAWAWDREGRERA